MSKLTTEEKVRRYHSIYDQIYTNPRIHVHDISKNLRVARNTVTGYLDYMYEAEILFGPELRLQYYPGLDKYLYLVRFDDPYTAFDELQRNPQIEYCSLFLGDWNVMFISSGEYDPSHISGIENLLLKRRRGDIVTPRVPLADWKYAFDRMRQQARRFDPNGVKESNFPFHDPPPWDDEEWKLFHEYEFNFRKKVTPVLRKNLISSDKFYQWLGKVNQYTTVLLRFYPDGNKNYTHFVFLFKTDFPDSVISLLSNLPTSVICIHIDDGLIMWLSIKSDMTFTDLSTTVHQMKTSGMIERFNQAIGMLYYIEAEEGYAQLR